MNNGDWGLPRYSRLWNRRIGQEINVGPGKFDNEGLE